LKYPEQGPADLQHQLVIVLKPELKDALHGAHGAGTVAQLEQGFTQTGQPVFVVGIKRDGLLEAPASPGIFFPS